MPTSPLSDSRSGTSVGCSAWLGVEAMTTLIVPTISRNAVVAMPVFIKGSMATPPCDLKSSYALQSYSVSLDTFPRTA